MSNARGGLLTDSQTSFTKPRSHRWSSLSAPLYWIYLRLLTPKHTHTCFFRSSLQRLMIRYLHSLFLSLPHFTFSVIITFYIWTTIIMQTLGLMWFFFLFLSLFLYTLHSYTSKQNRIVIRSTNLDVRLWDFQWHHQVFKVWFVAVNIKSWFFSLCICNTGI